MFTVTGLAALGLLRFFYQWVLRLSCMFMFAYVDPFSIQCIQCLGFGLGFAGWCLGPITVI